MGVSVLAGGKRAINGAELARCFSQGLGRTIRYQSLDLDQFELSIERHPDDLEFLARPFVQPTQMPAFEATDVTKWVAGHKAAYSMMPAPQAANA